MMGFKPSPGGHGDYFFKRLIEIRRIAIGRVSTVPFNPNATDRCAVLVNRNTAGIAAQTKRQPGSLDVRTGEGRKLDAIERPAGTKIDSRRKMFLDDEASRARAERVAA